MTIEFVTCSPQAIEAAKAFEKAPKYPFDQLQPGTSFRIRPDECKLSSLKTLASNKSKDGKRFVVVIHELEKWVEVARIS